MNQEVARKTPVASQASAQTQVTSGYMRLYTLQQSAVVAVSPVSGAKVALHGCSGIAISESRFQKTCAQPRVQRTVVAIAAVFHVQETKAQMKTNEVYHTLKADKLQILPKHLTFAKCPGASLAF